MRKNSLIVSLVVIFTGLIIGGVIMFNSFPSKDESKYKEEQDRIVQYIENHVGLTDGKPVSKIEFIEFKQNDMTGTWRITTKINETYKISFTEDELGGEIETSNYSPKEFKENDDILENNIIDNVEIDYFEE
ncbi:hypothetical protein [Streptococcus thoraltensis]|uniref:hypothetical protein n=1 Tax=Streptococcus thoraltensis TaxID=55085 RepID=UPI000584F1EB|nr:hypothetical protein [Streptococcus thoraltensis]